MNLDFNELFKFCIIFMKINRSHPDVPKDAKWLIEFTLIQGIYTLVFLLIVYSTIYHDLKNEDFTKICANGAIGVYYLIVNFDYYIMVKQQDRLKRLISTVQLDYTLASDLPVNEKNIISNHILKGQWLIKVWGVLISCITACFIFKSVYLMLYTAIVGNFTPVPIFEITYPAKLEEVKDSAGPFLFMYISMLCYLIYSCCLFMGVVPLGPIFMLHACGQLGLVKTRILNIFPEHEYSSAKAQRELKAVAIHLDHVYRFVADIQESFQLIYEIGMKAIMVNLPVILYQIKETYQKGELSLEFIALFCACIAFTIYPCYYGDLLLETGESVRQAVYTSGWEKTHDPRARSSLLIILTRTARPVAVRSMFNTLCLDTLTDVYKTSYRIFSVLNAAWE